MDKEEIEAYYNEKIIAKENLNKEQVIYSVVSVFTTMNNFEDWLCDDMKDKIANIKEYIEQLENRVKELEKRPTFYFDNNRNMYVWCCRCSDSNMSLHMFLDNGEIQQYASEHYDKWNENAKEVRQIDVCEFMHNFVKPLIKEKNNLKAKVKEQEEIKNKYLQKLVYALTPTTHPLDDRYNNAFKKIIAENIDLETCKIRRKLKECWGIDKY